MCKHMYPFHSKALCVCLWAKYLVERDTGTRVLFYFLLRTLELILPYSVTCGLTTIDAMQIAEENTAKIKNNLCK